MRKSILITAISLLGLMGCSFIPIQSQTTPSSRWQKVNSTPGKFTIEMPERPVQSTTNLMEGITVYHYTAIHNNSIYTVAYTKFAKSLTESQISTILSILEDALKNSLINGKIVSQVPLKKQGISCQEFMVVGKPDSTLKQEALDLRWKIKDEQVFLQGIHCLKGDHFVEAIITSQSRDELEGNGQYFFSSFKLNL